MRPCENLKMMRKGIRRVLDHSLIHGLSRLTALPLFCVILSPTFFLFCSVCCLVCSLMYLSHYPVTSCTYGYFVLFSFLFLNMIFTHHQDRVGLTQVRENKYDKNHVKIWMYRLKLCSFCLL
jgi:hypothetical protein